MACHLHTTALLLAAVLCRSYAAAGQHSDASSVSGDRVYGQCTAEDCEAFLKQNRYTADFESELAAKISHAIQAYKPCSGLSCYMDRLEKDLAPFKEGITRADIDQAKPFGVHYQIIDHKLYRQEKCLFMSRCEGVEHFILSVIHDLPDMDLIINVRDDPRVYGGRVMPLFSFSKVASRYSDIMYPAWTFWAGGPAVWPLYPRGLGRWDLMREEILQSAAAFPWDKKEKKGFFRGSRTSSERDPLVLLSRAHPELADAAYVKNQAYKGPKDLLYAEEADKVPLKDHCKWAYLFNFRGVAASFRHKHLFLCDSLVFHVGDDWLEFYYEAMKPWVHYVPVSLEMGEVQSLISFFKQHEDLARTIANNGKEFIENNLRMEDVTDYWRQLLLSYSKLQRYAVTKEPGLKQITQ